MLDCKASLETTENQISASQRIGISPEQFEIANSLKSFKLFRSDAKALENSATLQGFADLSVVQQNDTQCPTVVQKIFKNIQPISVGV